MSQPSQGRLPVVDPMQQVLVRLLDAAFGDDRSSRVLIHAALRTARRSALPSDPDALLDFVRAYMVGPLTEELGPRIVSAMLDDLAEELHRLKPPPSSLRALAAQSTPIVNVANSDHPKSSGVRLRASVALVDEDRFARASLARILVAASCDVAAVEAAADVRSHEGRFDVAVVNMSSPDVAQVLSELVTRHPNVRVVAIASDAIVAETMLRAAGVRRYDVVPRSLRSSELNETVRRLALAG